MNPSSQRMHILRPRSQHPRLRKVLIVDRLDACQHHRRPPHEQEPRIDQRRHEVGGRDVIDEARNDCAASESSVVAIGYQQFALNRRQMPGPPARKQAPRLALTKKKESHRRIVPTAVALLLAIAASQALATTLAGRVIHVADGDTITILDGQRTEHRVRLAGIDAPEKAQPYGDASRRALRDIVHGATVNADCPKTDPYGRLVCTVRFDGRDINLAQVESGMAWWFRRYASEQPPAERTAYEHAEQQARTARRGLWADPQPIPPWEWRKTHARGN